MSETDLILEAMNGSIPTKRKRMVPQEVEPPVVGYDAVIAKLAKRSRTKRSPAKRSVTQWNNTDFLRYVGEILDVEGLVLEVSGVRDRELMGKVYDRLADHYRDRMTNFILRQYLDWWVHSYACILRQRSIHPQMFLMERYVENFISFYDLEAPSKAPKPPIEKKDEDPVDLSDHALFELGGLPMLLMTEGIVISYKVLQERNESAVFQRLSTALRNLTRDAVEKVLDITLSKKTYNSKYAIDFISIAKSACEYYSIKKYVGIKYEEYFEN